jgi:hypothetical protein
MCIPFQPLPELTRVKDLKISGSAFADLSMVQEFLHNFSTALDIGKRGEHCVGCVFKKRETETVFDGQLLY